MYSKNKDIVPFERLAMKKWHILACGPWMGIYARALF
jgi:hypothetical protein